MQGYLFALDAIRHTAAALLAELDVRKSHPGFMIRYHFNNIDDELTAADFEERENVASVSECYLGCIEQALCGPIDKSKTTISRMGGIYLGDFYAYAKKLSNVGRMIVGLTTMRDSDEPFASQLKTLPDLAFSLDEEGSNAAGAAIFVALKTLLLTSVASSNPSLPSCVSVQELSAENLLVLAVTPVFFGGSFRSELDEMGSNLVKQLPTLAEVGPNQVQVWASVGPMWLQMSSKSAKFGRSRPKFSRASGKIARARPSWGRTR